jgi:hypothetical protein
MEKNGTLSGDEAAPKGEWEKRQAGGRLLGMGRLTASNEELKSTLARVRAALASGTMSEQEVQQSFALAQDAAQPFAPAQDATRAREQEQAILDELMERKVRAIEVMLGAPPRKVARARRKSDWTVEELYAAALPKPSPPLMSTWERGRLVAGTFTPLESDPWGSRSIVSTVFPASARAPARLKTVTVFPLPPFLLTIAITRVTVSPL